MPACCNRRVTPAVLLFNRACCRAFFDGAVPRRGAEGVEQLSATRDGHASTSPAPDQPSGGDAVEAIDAHLVEARVASTSVYDGHFLKVFRDTVRLPGGCTAQREFVRHPGAVMVVPLADDGRLVLERQHRYPLDRVLLEFPAGKLDPGESTLHCAQRELLEETGYRAREWAHAGRMHNAPAYSTEFIEIWFARGLVAGEQQLDEGEFIEQVQLLEEQASSSRSPRAASSPMPRRWSDCCACSSGAPARGRRRGRPRRQAGLSGASGARVAAMKVFDLRCGAGHAFEGWFASDSDFQSQRERGMLDCPMCGNADVVKLPSAPRLDHHVRRACADARAQRRERRGRPRGGRTCAVADPGGAWQRGLALRRGSGRTAAQHRGRRQPAPPRRRAASTTARPIRRRSAARRPPRNARRSRTRASRSSPCRSACRRSPRCNSASQRCRLQIRQQHARIIQQPSRTDESACSGECTTARPVAAVAGREFVRFSRLMPCSAENVPPKPRRRSYVDAGR